MSARVAEVYPSIPLAGKRADQRYTSFYQRFLNIAADNQIDIHKPISGMQFNVVELGTRLNLVTEACRSIAGGKGNKIILFPKSVLSIVDNSAKAITDLTRTLDDTIAKIDSETVSSLDKDQYTFSTPSGNSYHVGSTLKELDNFIDTILTQIYPISYSIRSKGFNPLSIATADLDSTANSVAQTLAEAKKQLTQTKTASTQAGNALRDIEVSAEAASTLSAQIAKHAESIEENKRSIDELLVWLEESGQTANEHEAFAASFLEKFKAFDNQIDERNKIHENTVNTLKLMQSQLLKTSEDAQAVTEKSKQALNLSTAYSLATSFGNSEDSVGKTIWYTGSLFFLSVLILIALVFIAVDPRVLWLLFPDLARGVLFVSGANDDVDVVTALAQSLDLNDTLTLVSNLGIRFLIILPGIVLVRVSARVFESQVVAKRQYKFKKTIATALPGFQEQVASEGDDDFRRQVTLIAFAALTENPDDRINTKASKKSGADGSAAWLNELMKRT